jgi:hypothetical protein
MNRFNENDLREALQDIRRVGILRTIGMTSGLVIGVKAIRVIGLGVSLFFIGGLTYLSLGYIGTPRYSVLIQDEGDDNKKTEVKLKIYPYGLITNNIEKTKISIRDGENCLQAKGYNIQDSTTSFNLSVRNDKHLTSKDIMNDFEKCDLSFTIDTLYRHPMTGAYRHKCSTLNLRTSDYVYFSELDIDRERN